MLEVHNANDHDRDIWLLCADMGSLTYQGYEYSSNIHAVGWCISLLGLLQLPIWAIYAILKQPGENWTRVSQINVEDMTGYIS